MSAGCNLYYPEVVYNLMTRNGDAFTTYDTFSSITVTFIYYVLCKVKPCGVHCPTCKYLFFLNAWLHRSPHIQNGKGRGM